MRFAGCRCTDHLKEIVYRCIGERRKRYESADEMIEALRNPPATLKVGVLRTLKGVHLAFTGILSKRRSEAVRAARRAGAIVHGGPSAKTTVVVRGRPNPLQAAGPRRRPEADGDQAAAREGAPDHAAERDAVLAPGRRASVMRPSDVPRTQAPPPAAHVTPVQEAGRCRQLAGRRSGSGVLPGEVGDRSAYAARHGRRRSSGRLRKERSCGRTSFGRPGTSWRRQTSAGCWS